jgi:hypothetical protein
MLTRESTAKLTLMLGLSATGREQDWDLELADPSRIDEFVALYQQAQLSLTDRAALMALVLASTDDYIAAEGQPPRAWATICRLLAEEGELHEDTVARWTREGSEDPAEWSTLTPYLRAGLG